MPYLLIVHTCQAFEFERRFVPLSRPVLIGPGVDLGEVRVRMQIIINESGGLAEVFGATVELESQDRGRLRSVQY